MHSIKKSDHFKYNNKLFKQLIPIYDPVASLLFPVRNAITKLFDGKESQKVIDIACGTGTQAILIARKGHLVTGVDISPDMINRARKKGSSIKVSFEINDASNIRYPDSTFDSAIISFALHDMPHTMRQKVVKEMERIVKPNGMLIFADYRGRSCDLIRKCIYWITKTWESRYYEDFLNKGLDYYIGENIREITRNNYLLGEMEVIVFLKNRVEKTPYRCYHALYERTRAYGAIAHGKPTHRHRSDGLI